MLFQGRGDEVANRLFGMLKSSLQGYEVTLDEAQTSGESWSRTISVRKGTWTGIDVDLKQEGEQGIAAEVDLASKGGKIGIFVGMALAVVLALASGDPILEAVGITRVRSNLTIAIAAIALMFVTVPLAMITTKIIGRGGAEESKALQGRVTTIVESARGA